ncbi:MAG: beta-lactamase family protein [Gemmatimonadetes bacterium]|nr:beta-lactamase family protein [Gemmatimonadota bacterium]
MVSSASLRASGVCVCILSLLPNSLLSQTNSGFDEAWARVSSELQDTLEATGMVGASWAFLNDGRILAHETFGFADLETSRLVDEATIYHWGSITKTLTGIAIFQLRDRGLLGLDDSVVEYVPELAQVHNPFGPMDQITLRHLLSHSSGFRGPTWPWGGGESWHPHEPTAWDQVVAMLPYTEILFPPGSRWSYSNPGIIFLGRVIETLSGEEWEVYVEKNILRPLGMHRSYFDFTPYHLLPYRSNNYTIRDGMPTANGLDFNTGITVSNGGLNAPLKDMARYLAFLTDSGSEEERKTFQTVLARTSIEEMWKEEVPIQEAGELRESMASSFFLEEFRGVRYVGHTGSQKAFFSFVYVHPESKTGAIVAFNSNGQPGTGSLRPNTRAILNWFREMLFSRVFPVFREPRTVPAVVWKRR